MTKEGIRVNAMCPGAVRTAIAPDWTGFDEDLFAPLDTVADLVLRLACVVAADGDGSQGQDLIDSRGERVSADRCYGVAVVASGKRFYIEKESAYCDDIIARTLNPAIG